MNKKIGYDDDGIGAGISSRLKEICAQHGAQTRLAEATGISISQLKRYISNQNQPTIGPLVRMAKAAGVCLDWLATGEGPKYVADRDLEKFDLETLEAALDTMEKVLVMKNQRADAARKARLTALIYDILTDDEDEEEEKSATILKLMKFAD